jgi:purine-nucleoside phosphorylase
MMVDRGLERPSAAAAVAELSARLAPRQAPELLIVLGSGLSELVDALEDPMRVGFESLPGLPSASVAGHRGAFYAGQLEGRSVLIQAGRLHRYEGHAPGSVSLPLRIAAGLGVRAAILTNAAGGIGPMALPGSIVVLEDLISPPGPGPLVGATTHGEARFPDMSEPFDRAWRDLAVAAAEQLGIPASRGVYGAMLGPAFETPAEIRMLRALGADVVGMSTADEVVQARALGVQLLGLSLVTNRAAGLRQETLAHAEVLSGAKEGAPRLERLIREMVRHRPGGG